MEVSMRPANKRGRSRSRSARPVKRMAMVRAPAVLQMRRPEKGSVDIQAAPVFDSTGTFTLLNGAVPGDNTQNRHGRKISLLSVSLRGYVYAYQGGTGPSNDFLRLIVFYDRQPNGAAPAVSDLLQDTAQAGGTTTNALANINISNADRFKVLRDMYWSIPYAENVASAVTGPRAWDVKPQSYKTFIKLGGMETHYNAGTAGTVADITTGSLYVLALGLNATVASQWKTAFSARVRFHDQ